MVAPSEELERAEGQPGAAFAATGGCVSPQNAGAAKAVPGGGAAPSGSGRDICRIFYVSGHPVRTYMLNV
jgi:hypothetical protein